MKKILAFGALLVGVLMVTSAHAGERTVCILWLDDGGVVPRPSAEMHTGATKDGIICPANRLQYDGGVTASDGGIYLTDVLGQVSTDGGVAGCPFCDLRGARSIALQCNDPVYVSEQWDGGVDQWNQRGVHAATSYDTLVDFDINPDPFRIDFRGGGATNHISVKPVAASATNFCRISTISRNVP